MYRNNYIMSSSSIYIMSFNNTNVNCIKIRLTENANTKIQPKLELIPWLLTFPLLSDDNIYLCYSKAPLQVSEFNCKC